VSTGSGSFFAVMRVLLIVSAVMVLILLLIATVSRPAAVVAIPGVVMGFVAMLSFGRYRPTIWALLALSGATWIAFLINTNTWASAVLMALVALAMGLAGRVGLRSVVLSFAVFSASALFPQPPPGGEIGTLMGATSTAAAIFVAGVISAVVFHLIAPTKKLPKSAITPWPDTIVNSTALVVTMFFGTLWVLTWDRTPVAAWLMVTILVLSQPYDAITKWRSAERVIGTLAGAILAAGFIGLLTAEWQTVIVAFVLLACAWSFRLSHPVVETGHFYWVYAFIWTPAMVLLAVPQGGSATLAADGQRVLLTLLAAIAVVLVTIVARIAVVRFMTPSDATTTENQP
jgi:hypothetical protein